MPVDIHLKFEYYELIIFDNVFFCCFSKFLFYYEIICRVIDRAWNEYNVAKEFVAVYDNDDAFLK